MDSNLKKYLWKMFPLKEKRNEFFIDCILTFGLRLSSLSKIFGYTYEELFKLVVYGNKYKYASLNKALTYGVIGDIEAEKNFLQFFQELVLAYQRREVAYKEKDAKKYREAKAKYEEVLDQLSDKRAISLMRKNKIVKPGIHLTDEEITIILKYQIKYLLSIRQIERLFPIDGGNYSKRVKKLKNPQLISYYNSLSDFNNSVRGSEDRRGR